MSNTTTKKTNVLVTKKTLITFCLTIHIVTVFNPSTNQPSVPYIRQILFGIHLGNNTTDDEQCRRTHKLFELFRSNNYAIFHKEPNLYNAQNVFEYALLQLNRAFFISPL